MTHSPENQHVIEREFTASMIRSGIPMEYHAKRLDDLGTPGSRYKTWIADQGGVDQLHAGCAVNVTSTGVDSTRLFLTLARSLVVGARMSVIVMPIMKLMRTVTDGTHDEYERIERVPVLFVRPFQDQGPSPLTTAQMFDVQEFLTERLESHRSLVLLTRQNATPWWTPDFLDVVRAKTAGPQ